MRTSIRTENFSSGKGESPNTWRALRQPARHRTGATGRKTVTCRAGEGFSRGRRSGVRADIKGDLSGHRGVGEAKDFGQARKDMGLLSARRFPWCSGVFASRAIGARHHHGSRPLLLSRMMDLTTSRRAS